MGLMRPMGLMSSVFHIGPIGRIESAAPKAWRRRVPSDRRTAGLPDTDRLIAQRTPLKKKNSQPQGFRPPITKGKCRFP